MSKTVLSDVDGFTPVIDDLLKEVGLMAALVFGRVWRYCQMEQKVCCAAMETVAEDLGLTIPSVRKYIGILVEKGYLEDTTPDLKGHPHRFADTGKAGMIIRIQAGSKKSLQPEVKQMGVKNLDSQLSKNFTASYKKSLHKDSIKKESKEELTAVPAMSAIFSFDGEADVIPETVLTSKKKGAGAKSTAGPYYHDEAVQIYRGITRLTPNLIQQEKIHEEVHDLNLWKSTVEWFMVDGKDKTKVGWMIDSYKKGGKEKVIAGYIEAKRNGNGHQPEREHIAAEEY